MFCFAKAIIAFKKQKNKKKREKHKLFFSIAAGAASLHKSNGTVLIVNMKFKSALIAFF
jgi:hypothetical protein